jgi:flagellar motor switch protein FliN/FliY
MAEHEVGLILKDTFDAVFRRAGAELAEALGSPASAAVEAGKLLCDKELQRLSVRPWLLLSGALGGAVAGQVVFAVELSHAARLARQAAQDAAEAEEGPSLSEEDVAAVAFALARVGAAAKRVWSEELGHEVRWPAEPTDLSAERAEAGQGGDALQAAVGGLEAASWVVHLGEPAGVDLLVALPASVAASLARLLDPEAHWADPAAAEMRRSGLLRLLPVELPVRVVVARRSLTLRELLQLVPGRVLDLEKRCDQPLELYAASKLVARGDAMLVEERFGFRVIELVEGRSTADRPRKVIQ